MVNEIVKEMNGIYVKNNAGEISSRPTNKVFLPYCGITKVKDLYLVYERWSREQGREPRITRKQFITKSNKPEGPKFEDLFD